MTARALPAAALVSWQAPRAVAGVRVTGYTVIASPGGATATTTGATNVVVKGLANGTRYRFTVRARGAAGDGPVSAVSPAVTPSATGVVYAHDADGRVTAVFDGTGAGSKISYDAVGNITGIANLPATSLAVAQVWPPKAKAGATVDVFGTGFGTDAAAVSVDFHGASAKPSTVTANHFQVRVPAAASSGTLTVTIGSGSAAWPGFTVLTPVAPVVSGVDKRVVDGGGTVTVTGTGFDTDRSRDVVSINGTKATVTAATATTLTVSAPPFPVAGPVSVRTPDGTASGPDVVVPPTPYQAADVSWAGRITPNATTTVNVTGEQQIAVALFEVAPGQQGSVEVAHETFANDYELHVYDPTGQVVAHRESVSGDIFFNLSYLSTPGTYTVEIDPAGTDTGSVQVTPGVFTDPTATATVDGGPASLTTTIPGQKAVFSIAGQADQRIMVAVSQDDAADVETVSLVNPAGSVLTSISGTGSGVGPVLLPVTGTYTLVVTQYSTYTGTVTAQVNSVPPDLRQNLTVDGSTANLTIAAPGQKAYLTFAGTEGQVITAEMTPSWGWYVCEDDLTLNDPSGNQVYDSPCDDSVDRITLPATGTYTLAFDPWGTRSGAFTARVFTVPADDQVTTAVNGQPASVTIGADDQRGVFSFAATAGQKVFVACSLSGDLDQYNTAFRLTSASGDTRTSECDQEIELFDTSTLDATGTDTITVIPGLRQTGTATITIYPVPDDAQVTAPVDGTPTAVTIGTPGQHGLYSFAATAGDQLRVTCSLSSTLNQYNTKFVYTSASGTTNTGYCYDNPLFDTFTLDATGTDTIAVLPAYGETGTVTLTLSSVPTDVQVTTAMNGQPATATITTPGQHAAFSFAATSGQRLYAACSLSGLSSSSTWTFTSASGTTKTGYCYGGGSPLFDTFTLDATGTDTITVTPYNGGTGSATLTLYTVPADAHVSTAMNGQPATATIGTPGQHATFTFAATSGQRLYAACSMTGLNTSSTWTFTSASGTTKTGYCYGGGSPLFDTFTLDATGTDTITLAPYNGTTGSAALTLYTVPADVHVSTAMNGQAATATIGAPGQHATFTFAATSGQRLYAACSMTGLNTSSTWTFTSASGTTDTGYCYGGGEPLFDTFTLDGTGTDTITLSPYNGGTGSAMLTLYTVPADTTAAATVGGPAVTLSTSAVGQDGAITFTGTAGQQVTLTVTALTYPSSPCCVSLTVRDPANSQVASLFGPTAGDTRTFPTAASGAYTIVVDPAQTTTGSVTVTLTRATAAAARTALPTPAPPRPAPVVDGGEPQHGGGRSAPPPKAPAAPKAAPRWVYRGTAAGGGPASLTGVVRDTAGKPLADVLLRVDGLSAITDGHGRFTLDGLPRGTRVLVIDGRAAGPGHRDHGVYSYRLRLKAGRNGLGYTPYLPLIDTAAQVRIDEPVSRPVVLTTPKVPGLEVHIPAGARITDVDGKPVRKLGITPIPIDRTPIPMPPGVQIPIFFTVQPAGGVVTGGDVQVVYPNYLHDKPGTLASFWHYEKAGEGWESYGRGTVDTKGAQVVPASGTVLHDFDGAMFNTTDGRKPADKGGFWDKLLHGDPVDTSTGLLQLHQTDLALPDVIPLDLDRAYNSGDTDPNGNQRPEGVGTDDTYDMFLSSTNQWQVADLNLADGSQVHYARISPGTGYIDAVMESQVSSGPFYRSRMYWNGLGWDVNLTSGTTLVFGEMAPLQQIRDAHGNTLVVIRAEKNTFGSYVGPVTSVRSPHGFWLDYSADANGRTTKVADNAGRQVSYGYDTAGHLHTVTDVDNHTTTYNYDPTTGLLASVVDAKGQTALTNSYDGNGLVHQQTLADGGHYTFDYTVDGDGKVTATRTTDPAGHVTRDTFDNRGMVTATTGAPGTARQRTTTYTRDPATGLVSAVTDPLGHTTSYLYDEFGNVTKTTFRDGTPAKYSTGATFNGPFGRADTVTDALGHTTTLTWTPAGDLATVEDPLHHSAVNAYNPDGTLRTSTDPLHHTTSYAYTDGLLTGVTDPDGHTSTMFRDTAGRAIVATAPSGLSGSVAYDAANLPLTRTDPAGNTTRFGYDNNGNLTSVTDPLQHITRYTPDVMDRVQVRTDPLGHTDTYSYDPDGQIQNYTDRRGTLTVYGYDDLERRSTATYGKTSTGAESTVTYGYDATDRLTGVTDSATGTIAIGYDDLANTVTTTDSTGTITDSYDNAGRLVTASASGLTTTSYGYDDAGQLKTITRGSQQVSYGYDDAGRQTSRTLPGGVTITPGYTNGGLLTGLTYAAGGGTVGTLNYSYDTDNQRIADTGSWARTTLPAAESGQAYDADDRLTAVSGHTLTYDDTGNLLSDGTTGYTWNARGQLTGVSQPGGGATLSYDAGNRLAGVSGSAGTTSYRYAGQALLTRTAGGSATSYLNGPGLDDPLTATTGSTTQDLLPDLLGSTVATTDLAGNPTSDYTYNLFGAASSDNPTDGNPLRYTGRPSGPDLPAGLQDNRARDYSPALHRFLSADPVGHASGQTDAYTYAAGDPADHTDPSGNWVQYAAACAIGAGYEAFKGWLTGTKHSWGDYLGGALNGCAQGALLVTGFGAEEELGLEAVDALEAAPADEAALGDICALNSFTADTRVEMAGGGSKPISDVRVGDKVLATDPVTGATAARTVTALIRHRGPHTMVRIAMTGGGSLRATDHHPFWDVTTHRWTDAVDLRAGDQLREPDGTLVTVAGTTPYTADLTAYNLTVDTTHSYYVLAGETPVLVHNSGCLPTPGEAQELVEGAEPVGSAMKDDAWHRSASWAVDDIAENGTVFNITGGDGVERVLIQVPGEVNGVAGRFEWILDGDQLTHQMFVRGGTINGIPIKP